MKTKFMEHIIDNIVHPIFVINKNTDLIFINDQMTQKYGYSKKDILTMKLNDIDLSFNTSDKKTFWKELKNKKHLRIHTLYKDKSGKEHPVSIHLYYVDYEEEIYAFGVIEDENYIQAFLDMHDEFIILTDGKSICAANKKIVEFFNYSSFASLKADHDCICDFFLNEPGFTCDPSRWRKETKKDSDNTLKVKIKRKDTDEVSIFSLKISLFHSNRYFVRFTDITKTEKYKSKLEHLAFTDALTSLYNRYQFNGILSREINRAKRYKKSLAFIMLDVDYFKEYNDTYGHINGDKTLRKIANSIKNTFRRASDFCFRLGGEEFGIICTMDSFYEIKKLSERLLTSVEDLHIEHKASSISSYVTVSIGVAIHKNDISVQDLYSFADIELYRAKKSGRNRICIHGNP